MTLLASWIGVDTHGPTSAYIVSDSRISWPNTEYYDFGKKVFASRRYPEVFGYAGNVLFPSTVLSQIIEMIDSGLLFENHLSCSEKHKIVMEKLRYSFEKYPDEFSSMPIQILHISRDTCFDKYPSFHCYLMTWDRKNNWKNQECNIPQESDLLFVLGSGSIEFNRNYSRYQSGANKSTSRNVFHCFIDTLRNTSDPHCGGAPQLVGINRKPLSSAQNYGILYNNRRYYLGMEVPKNSSYQNIEWRNDLFELCDGPSKKKFESASKHNDPLRRR